MHGKRAESTIGELKRVVAGIGSTEPDLDYWEPTAGNAGRALFVLLCWAEILPHGIWSVA